MKRPGRRHSNMAKTWLIVGVTLVVGLMAAAVAMALVTTLGGPHLLSADSPEGVVQRYLLALEKEDYPEAYSYLSSELQARCSLDGFVRNAYRPYNEEDQQVTLEKTQRYDGSALVRARVTSFYTDAPFGGSEYSYDQTFTLKLEADRWGLTGPGWGCPPF
jgi:hypothetical protein